MKKLIPFLLITTLLAVVMTVGVAPMVQAGNMAAGEDYVYVDGENFRNVEMPLAFTDKLVYGDAVVPVETLGTTGTYNLCPPQDGVTVLVFFRNDCHYYRDARRFFQSLSLATWVDDPRIRIVAVDCTDWNNGGYPMSTYAFAQKYAYGCYESVEWYNALGPGFHYISWLSRFEKYGIGEAYVAILSNGETTDVYGNTVPAYCVDYVSSNKALQSTDMLDETLSYIFPDLDQAVGQYTPPSNQTWTVNVVGDRDYAAAQKIYEKNNTQRNNYWVDPKQPMILDEELTELAMQRAAEIAIHFDHTRPDGRGMNTIFAEKGYKQTDPYYAENISFTTTVDDLSTPDVDESVEHVYQGWVNSGEHFINMMWGGGKVGVGCFRVGDRSFWVQIYDGSPCTTGTVLTRTDEVEAVTPVRTTTDKLNLKLKRSLYGEVDKPVGYIITHEGGSIDNRYSLRLSVHSYDATIKTLGTTIATAEKDGANLAITVKRQGVGVMDIKLAPEQTDFISVRVNSKASHAHAYTAWGRWKTAYCHESSTDRRYCSCGHYEEEVLPIAHIWRDVAEIPATCQQAGQTAYIQCRGCFTNKIEPQVIPALGHKPVVEIAGRAPTCSQVGFTDKLRCSVCDMVTQRQEVINTLPHTEVVIPAVDATCAEGGYTEGKKCSVCNKQTVDPIPTQQLEHVWQTLVGKPATCQTTGLTDGLGCKGCGLVYTKQEEIPKTSHRIVTTPGTPATCQGPGRTDGSQCGDCGKVMYEGIEIPQRGHSYTKVKGTPATCKATGLTDGKACSMCGLVSQKQEVIPKTGHKYSNDCDTTCNVCDATRTAKHDFKYTVNRATTAKDGVYTRTCNTCKKVEKQTVYRIKSIALTTTSYTYDGKVKSPTVKVTDSKGNALKKDTDYTVSYASGRKNAGTYKVTVTFKNTYSGNKTLTFKVKPADVSKCKLSLSATSYTYSGSAKKPTVTVKSASGSKLSSSNYTVTYASGRKNVGTYKVTVKMKGNYTGTKTLTFKILPPKTSLSKLTAASKALTVKWTKKTTQVTGYEIQYSTSKSFSSAKTKTVTKNSTTSVKLSGLSAKKTYYVRIRTYKTVSGKKVYSGWSTVKSLKTK